MLAEHYVFVVGLLVSRKVMKPAVHAAGEAQVVRSRAVAGVRVAPPCSVKRASGLVGCATVISAAHFSLD